MSASLLSTFRLWHRKLASLLFAFFFIISITGVMLGWKYLFTKSIFDNKEVKVETKLNKWLPLDSLEKLATVALNEKTSSKFEHAENIQLKPAKGFINFSFKNNYTIQVDGATGAAIHIEQKNGGIIQDIHDGAIVGDWFNFKTATAKTIYSTIMGLSLLFLTISGTYLWWKPKQIKNSKNKNTA
jgi:uncharacterized iron-regulated membrane protein